MWCEFSRSQNPNKLFEPFDLEKYNSLAEIYKSLGPDQKSLHKGMDDYIVKNGGPDITPLNRNYKLIIEENQKRMESDVVPELYKVDAFSREESIQDLLSSFENDSYIKEAYRDKKHMVRSGINTSEATVLIDCIRQGRTLLQAGKNAEILAKPLIDFYAANAYAYTIIVLNSSIRKSIDSLKGSHGHSYDHTNSAVDFGGDLPSGTFMDLLCALSVVKIKSPNEINAFFKYSVLPSIDLVQNNNIKMSLQSLLSMVPEINSCYLRYDNQHKNIHPLAFDTEIKGAKSITYNFFIGDGITKPDKEKLKKCFNVSEVLENQGSYKISISAGETEKICPIIYRDIYGKLWYVESPIDGLYLPEICLHFLIISALCNIMRYSPHEWSNILTNKESSQYSLLINQYIRLFEQKFPLLVVECITNYLPTL